MLRKLWALAITNRIKVNIKIGFNEFRDNHGHKNFFLIIVLNVR